MNDGCGFFIMVLFIYIWLTNKYIRKQNVNLTKLIIDLNIETIKLNREMIEVKGRRI